MCFKTRRASVRNFTVQSAIKSATTFLEKSREVVLEKWFFKLEFFFMVNHFSRTRKKIRVCRTTFLQTMWITGIHPPFFWSTTFLEPEKKNPSLKNHFSRPRFHKPDFLNQISWIRFLEPLFYTFLEKWLQIKWFIIRSSNVEHFLTVDKNNFGNKIHTISKLFGLFVTRTSFSFVWCRLFLWKWNGNWLCNFFLHVT
jgi:hypothetical protein